MGNRVTLKQVAARAGVSYQTISKILNNQVRVSPETEPRIWQAVTELNYRPNSIARSLRVQCTHKISYSWEPTPPDVPNPVLDQFMQSMVSQTESTGYYLCFWPPGRAPLAELAIRSAAYRSADLQRYYAHRCDERDRRASTACGG